MTENSYIIIDEERMIEESRSFTIIMEIMEKVVCNHGLTERVCKVQQLSKKLFEGPFKTHQKELKTRTAGGNTRTDKFCGRMVS